MAKKKTEEDPFIVMEFGSSFHSKVAGTSQKNPDGSDRQEYIKRYAKEGDELLMVPEPYNTYSPAAIGLFVVRDEGVMRKTKTAYQLGYVSAAVAPKLHQLWAEEKRVRGFVSEVTGGTRDKPTRGVNLLFEVTEQL